jgi:type IV pilus assembly protein PilM
LSNANASASLAARFYQLGPVRRIDRWLQAMPRPDLVIEIASGHVAVARWNGSTLESASAEALSTGSVMASPLEANVTQPDAVRSALRAALNRVPSRGTPFALLIPDPVVRVFILPFDTLPRGADEALPLLRWRLKKSVPFDMDETVVSWMRQSGREGNLEVVTAVARQRIIREYEEIVESVTGPASVVISSTLATLPLLEDRGATLLVRMCGKVMTTVVVHDSTLCVYRATEMAAEAGFLDPQAMLDEIFPAIAYFQDSWGSTVNRVRIAGFGSRSEMFAEALSKELNVSVGLLADSESARQLDSPARDLLRQDLDAMVGWMMNGGS